MTRVLRGKVSKIEITGTKILPDGTEECFSRDVPPVQLCAMADMFGCEFSAMSFVAKSAR